MHGRFEVVIKPIKVYLNGSVTYAGLYMYKDVINNKYITMSMMAVVVGFFADVLLSTFCSLGKCYGVEVLYIQHILLYILYYS